MRCCKQPTKASPDFNKKLYRTTLCSCKHCEQRLDCKITKVPIERSAHCSNLIKDAREGPYSVTQYDALVIRPRLFITPESYRHVVRPCRAASRRPSFRLGGCKASIACASSALKRTNRIIQLPSSLQAEVRNHLALSLSAILCAHHRKRFRQEGICCSETMRRSP